MRIETVDYFYLAMPTITLEGDGSQDVLLVRVRAGGFEGWGECEASPLVSIMAACCPRSHVACQPVNDAVLNAELNSPDDILRINRKVQAQGLDLLQTDHTLSGIDVALWDLLARKEGVPVWQLMGAKRNFPKLPYASMLFGDTPDETWEKARKVKRLGFTAAKFGWNNFGAGDLQDDEAQLVAAREGLGQDAELMVDAGTIWLDQVEPALERIRIMEPLGITWLEEPFVSGALSSYNKLARLAPGIPLAGGEGSHNFWMAQHLIQQGNISFIQIDAGRVGGITTARKVAGFAHSNGVSFVNHTFTSHLALSASLQAYVDLEGSRLAEYPLEPKPVCRDLTVEFVERGVDGLLRAPEAPGLGVKPRWDTVRKYLKQVRIEVDGKLLYETPECED